jgi:hypothetical protein
LKQIFFITSSYLFSRVRGQIKYENREERDAHTRNDEVDGVEECLSPQGHVESDVWKKERNGDKKSDEMEIEAVGREKFNFWHAVSYTGQFQCS